MGQQQNSVPASTPYQQSKHTTSNQYNRLLEALFSQEHVFYSPPTSPHKLLIPQKQSSTPDSLPTISALSLHPVLESVLHILNCDLPSAHFLCRHAEVDPKWESMYVHGILHRVEGDIDNTRCWYGDVKDTDMFEHVWATSHSDAPQIACKGWEHFLDRLERYRDRSNKRHGQGGWEQDEDKLDLKNVGDWNREAELLRETSLWEIKMVLQYCEKTFGVGEVADASEHFLGRMQSGNEEHAKVAQSMITGGEGWRTF